MSTETQSAYAPTSISKAFGAALAKAQSEMDTVTRNAINPAFKRGNDPSRYADISAVLEAVKPALNNHGIAMGMPALNRDDGCVGAYLELRFEDEIILVPPFWIKPASGIPHAMLSALTYARRGVVTSYFCIPQDDDDGNTASNVGGANQAEYAPPTVKRNGHAPAQEPLQVVNGGSEDAKVAAKAAFEAFAAMADDYGFNRTDKPSLILLAQTLCRKDKPATRDLDAALIAGSDAWDQAIDKVHAELASITPPTDTERRADATVTEAESAATVQAMSR